MAFDPYSQLDLQRDAAAADVRAAYKRRAKETHPDKGGDPEAFRLVQLAYDVLSDPERRARFDRDGVAEDAKPNNDRATALGLIDGHMGPIIQRYVMGGFKAEHDPRRMDLLEIITGNLDAEISSAHNSIHQGEQAVAFMRDMAKRFSIDGDSNPLAAKFEAQIAATEKSIADVREGIRLRLLAIDILDGYDFEHDQMSKFPRGSWDQPVEGICECCGRDLDGDYCDFCATAEAEGRIVNVGDDLHKILADALAATTKSDVGG